MFGPCDIMTAGCEMGDPPGVLYAAACQQINGRGIIDKTINWTVSGRYTDSIQAGSRRYT